MPRLLTTIALLGVCGLALVACQSEDATTQEEGNTNQDATTTTPASSTSVGPVTLTTLVGWGSNGFGQLGNGIPLPYGNASTTPVEVVNLNGVDLKAIAAGSNHSLALKDDGTAWAWGDNFFGQLGDGTNTDSSTPVQVKDPTDPTGYLTGLQEMAAGGSWFSLALKNDGTVWSWGSNGSGQLGSGSTADGTENICEWIGQGSRGSSSCTDSSTPVQVKDPTDPTGYLTGVKAIAADIHSLALKEDGTVWAWGSNQSGQLGNGTRDFSPILGYNAPVQVSELRGVKAIAVGADYNLAGW